MLILDATTKSLEVVLGGAITTNQLPFTAHYVDSLNADESVSAISENDGATNSTTPVTMVAAPSSGHTRHIKQLSVYNSDTAAATVTVQINNNSTTRIVWKGTLAVGDTLVFGEE